MIETALYVVAFVIGVPLLIVVMGYIYGAFFSTNVGSVDDAVSKGLEARRDTEPEDSNDE